MNFEKKYNKCKTKYLKSKGGGICTLKFLFLHIDILSKKIINVSMIEGDNYLEITKKINSEILIPNAYFYVVNENELKHFSIGDNFDETDFEFNIVFIDNVKKQIIYSNKDIIIEENHADSILIDDIIIAKIEKWIDNANSEYKLKKITENSSKINIVTYNVYMYECNRKWNLLDFMMEDGELKKEYNDVIICTQEDTKSFDIISNKFKRIKVCGKLTEKEAVYTTESNFNNVIFDKCIEINGKPAISNTRSAIIFSSQGIKIANLHLEGGRFFDMNFYADKFDILNNYKLQLINAVVEEKPDIILGDFNSVYSNNENRLKEFIDKQQNYYRNSKPTVYEPQSDLYNQRVIDLNISPYNILVNNGYTYAIPSNEDGMITNGRGNSIIDCIWYKKDKLFMEFCKIEPVLQQSDQYNVNNCISDHNPVHAIFTIS